MDGFFTQSSYGQTSLPSSEKTRLMLLIISMIVIAVLAYFLYKRLRGSKNEIVVPGPYNMEGLPPNPQSTSWKYLLTSDQTNAMTSNNITCSFFLFVENPAANVVLMPEGDYSRLQYLLNFGGSALVKIDPVHQEMVLEIVEIRSTTPTAQTDPGYVTKKIIVKNIQNAKWNQITFSIEGRTLDIYVNGTLATSALLDNVPAAEFSGIWLNESPDFDGQVAMIQAWPMRRTASSIMDNYQRKTDLRGKPYVPDPKMNILDFFKGFCSLTGFCGFNLKPTPLEFVDYEFA